SSTTGNITFSGALDSEASASRDVTVSATGGSVTFAGIVGATKALQNLTVTAGPSGTISINNNAVTTTQDQTYNSNVNFGNGAGTTTLSGNDVMFAANINGARQLVVNTSGTGTTTFTGPVSIGSLTTNADGKTIFGNGTVT